MKFNLLGTGGSIPIPRIGCECSVCVNARNFGKPYKRNCSSLFLTEINTLFDCPEDINSSINENGILEIDHLFITHWHPDHTFGIRLLMEHCFNFYENKVTKQFFIYLPQKVYDTLKKVYPSIEYQLSLKTSILKIISDRDYIFQQCHSALR